MKVGDKFPVTLNGHVVAQAVVHGMADGTATLRFAATEVVMGVRSELTDLPAAGAPAVETIVDEVVRETAAPVVETPNDTTLSQTTEVSAPTPVGAAEVATSTETKPDSVVTPDTVTPPAEPAPAPVVDNNG